MQSVGVAGALSGTATGRFSEDLRQELALRSERAMRFRLGRLHFEFRLRREPVGTAVDVSPELTDGELVRLARRSDATYAASWERSLATQYGATGNLP